jgi:hypothetical protein
MTALFNPKRKRRRPMKLNERDTARPAKLCGMFGSDHDSERAAAAAVADKLVRGLGFTWPEIISSGTGSIATVPGKIAFALANIVALSMWERGFLYSINGKTKLSDKQLHVLDQIIAKTQWSRP